MKAKVSHFLESYHKQIENLRFHLGANGEHITTEERLLIRQRIKDFQNFIDTLKVILEYDR